MSANPQASVSYGTAGTVNLSALIGTSALKAVDAAGPRYAAFQYLSPFPSSPGLLAAFSVQLWSNGRYRVRVSVETGSAVTGNLMAGSTVSGTATVSIGGVQRFSGALSTPIGARWDVAAVAGVDPQIAPRHDVVALRRSRLVPNYGFCNVPSARLDGLSSAYVPMSRLSYEQNMGATGFSTGIGLLPQAEAMYVCTGDPRAWRSVVAHGSAYGSYSIYFRDRTTWRMPRPSDWPMAYTDNEDPQGNSERMTGRGTNMNEWEFAHHPNACFLPWLLTGERYYLECLQSNAWASYYTTTTSAGAGTNRSVARRSQVRGTAWRFRTIAAAAALSPDSDPAKLDWAALARRAIADLDTTYAMPATPATGLGYSYDDQDGASSPGWGRSLFEYLFVTSAHGWAWDLDLPSQDPVAQQRVRDYFYRVPVGLCGRGPAFGEFSYRQATGPYRSSVGPAFGTWYSTWGEVWTATFGSGFASSYFADGQSISGSYADDASTFAFPQGNWGHVLTALSYAVDHGALGAAAAHQRLTGASNWASNANRFHQEPQYGIVPR